MWPAMTKAPPALPNHASIAVDTEFHGVSQSAPRMLPDQIRSCRLCRVIHVGKTCGSQRYAGDHQQGATGSSPSRQRRSQRLSAIAVRPPSLAHSVVKGAVFPTGTALPVGHQQNPGHWPYDHGRCTLHSSAGDVRSRRGRLFPGGLWQCGGTGGARLVMVSTWSWIERGREP